MAAQFETIGAVVVEYLKAGLKEALTEVRYRGVNGEGGGILL